METTTTLFRRITKADLKVWRPRLAKLGVRLRLVKATPERYMSIFDDGGWDGKHRILYINRDDPNALFNLTHEVSHILTTPDEWITHVNYGYGGGSLHGGGEKLGQKMESAASDMQVVLTKLDHGMAVAARVADYLNVRRIDPQHVSNCRKILRDAFGLG